MNHDRVALFDKIPKLINSELEEEWTPSRIAWTPRKERNGMLLLEVIFAMASEEEIAAQSLTEFIITYRRSR